MYIQKIQRFLWLSMGALLSFSMQSEVLAQPTDSVEEVTVTGSRIKRDDLTANSPIAVVDAQDIRLVNTTNLEEFLRDRPEFVAGVGANGNNGNDGAATVDLRNLGEERTLVLVNGKRFTPYDYQGFVDLGMIPTSLVQRVEIITGGASAVYGSDAVGGVVNLILRNDFEGVELDISTGATFESDGDRDDISLTIGGNVADGRGNVVLNMGFTRQKAVFQGDRPYSVESLDDLLNASGSPTHPNGSILANYPTVTVDTDGFVQFADNGDLVDPIQYFNFNPFNLLQTPQKKFTATVLADFDISDDIKLFARGSFANNQINTVIAPTGTFFFPYLLNVNNPFLTTQAQAVFAAQDAAETLATNSPGNLVNDGFVDISFGRRLTELGTRDSLYENTAFQFVTGLEGKLGDNWEWELFVQRGRTSRTQNFINDVNYNNSKQAMLAITDDAGTPADPSDDFIRCQDISGGCAPANYFGPNNLSEAAADFIRLNLNENNKTDQTIWGGVITGDLPVSITESPIAVAAGIEIRRDDARNLPDGNYSGGNSPGFGSSSPVDAGIEIVEYFGEARIPLLENAGLAQEFALELGFREANYENTVGAIANEFDNSTWKFGAEWTLNDAIRFRAMANRAVRAPNIEEIGLPLTPSTGDLTTDPCEGSTPVGNSSLTALCVATGVPASNIGSVTSIAAGQINNFVGGNPSLKPEEADTLTAGAVITLENLTLSIDYYSIEIDDVILQPSEQNVVNNCYNIEQDAGGEFCQRILRNPLGGGLIGGNETGVDVSLINAGFQHVTGVDIGANYSLDIDALGGLDFAFNAVRVLQNEQKVSDNSPVEDCAGLVGNTCVSPEPEWRFTQTTRWTKGALTAQLRWQHIGEVTQDAIVLDGAPATDYAMPKISAHNYFDLTATYDLNDNLTVRAGINNLLDKDPPIVGNEYGGTLENSGNTFPATYDPLGRAYFVGLNLHF